MLADFRKSFGVGRFPGFTSMSFCYEQHVDEYEYGIMVH